MQRMRVCVHMCAVWYVGMRACVRVCVCVLVFESTEGGRTCR